MIGLSGDYPYQRSADLAVKTVKLSKKTVKNKIRELGEIDNRVIGDFEEKGD
jgi:hypothetical protein